MPRVYRRLVLRDPRVGMTVALNLAKGPVGCMNPRNGRHTRREREREPLR